MKLLLPLVWGCTSAGWTYAADVGFEESAVVRRLQDGTMLVHLEFTNTAPASVRFLLFIIIFTLHWRATFFFIGHRWPTHCCVRTTAMRACKCVVLAGARAPTDATT